jgi:site-specific recombinase XerD
VPTSALAPPIPETFVQLRRLVLDSLTSPHSRRAYAQALDHFFSWYQAEPRGGFSRAVVQAYRSALESAALAPSTINVRLAALRKLAGEAAENGLLDRSIAQSITSLKGTRHAGVRAGNWLTPDDARRLLGQPDTTTVRGKRDRAILELLIRCGLRRTELAALRPDDLGRRDGRWVIVDLKGKGSRLRTVPVPASVNAAIDDWSAAAPTAPPDTPLFPLSDKMIWHIVSRYAASAGLPNVAPHDLRRTCAKLCRAAGGELEQIQFLLGHASIQTTERYLGSRQDLARAVNDDLL